MTDKEKVLAVWPDAVCRFQAVRGFQSHPEDFKILAGNIGTGPNEESAWADAASRLPKSPTVEASPQDRCQWSLLGVGQCRKQAEHEGAHAYAPAPTVEAEAGAAQDVDPLSIACPLCKREAGQRCYEKHFGVYEFTHHNARIEAAKAAPPAICAEPPQRPTPQGGDYRPHYNKREADKYMTAIESEVATVRGALKRTVKVIEELYPLNSCDPEHAHEFQAVHSALAAARTALNKSPKAHICAGETQALTPVGTTWEHSFKNFHRNLCERFGYVHDEVDWFRDQASLEEYIAGELKAAAEPHPAPEMPKAQTQDVTPCDGYMVCHRANLEAKIAALEAQVALHNDSAVEARRLAQEWQSRVFELEAQAWAAKGGHK